MRVLVTDVPAGVAVMIYVRFPLSLRNDEDLLHERGIDITHETVRFWWVRFASMFARSIRKQRVKSMKTVGRFQWHLDEALPGLFRLQTGAQPV